MTVESKIQTLYRLEKTIFCSYFLSTSLFKIVKKKVVFVYLLERCPRCPLADYTQRIHTNTRIHTIEKSTNIRKSVIVRTSERWFSDVGMYNNRLA